jgi:hypothetical protein
MPNNAPSQAFSETSSSRTRRFLQWMRAPRLNSAAAARDEVIAEFGGDAGKLASEILHLRTVMGHAANALTRARAAVFDGKDRSCAYSFRTGYQAGRSAQGRFHPSDPLSKVRDFRPESP